VKAFLVCAACLLLGGCRGDAPPAPERPATASEPVDDRPVIVAFGDSLTAGFGVDPPQSYPAALQRLLDQAGHRYRVMNAGISGDTSGGGLDRLDSVVQLKPRVVIVELGANDGLRGLPLASTRSNLDEIITGLKGTGAQVVLAGMTLPRNYGSQYIREFERIFTELAKKHSIPLIPFLLAGFAETGRHMQPDQLHPTAEGNRIVADTVFKAIKPLL
jgi:acyl-CoA thioesterase-1